jgi:fructose-1,6-bisphosphatase/inositol monophosphatase family enzyme
LADALVAFNSIPAIEPGWRQARILGAAALDLCAVGAGILDAYIDFTVDALGPWDYLGGLLVCQEAGAAVEDAWGRDLVVREHAVRRTPLAASTPALLDEVRTARNSVDSRRGA